MFKDLFAALSGKGCRHGAKPARALFVAAFIGLMGMGLAWSAAADTPPVFDFGNFTLFEEAIRGGSVDELQKDADKGDPEAQYALGLHFLTSEDVDRSARKAVELFRKAAASGHVAAKSKLGECYFNEYGVFLDYAMAAKWAGEAAEEGYPPALKLLGDCHMLGWGVDKDRERGWELFTEAARKGYAPAIAALASYYYDTGAPPVEKDQELALRLHLFAAEHGALESQRFLVRYYSTGERVPKDETEALQWRRKMAEQGEIGALYRISVIANEAREQQEKDELAKGFETLVAKAEAGDSEARIKVGDCHANGYGTERNTEFAYFCYLITALEGVPEAQKKLADLHLAPYLPDGGRNDYFSEEEAVEWYRKADEAGYLPATVKLALIYYSNPMTRDKLGPMVKMAAEAGDPEAQRLLANMYLRGEGVERNGTLARVWFLKALRNGYIGQDDYRSFVEPAVQISFKRYTAVNGDAGDMYKLGFAHYFGFGVDQDAEIASRWFRKAAEAGDIDAQTTLAEMLVEGDGIPRDMEEGLALFRQAADRGDAFAQLRFGTYSLSGAHGAPQDCGAAVDYLTRAAEQGSDAAQYALAVALRDGACGSRDFDGAEKWMRRAAEQNHPQATLALGKMYSDRCGVKADYPRAKALFEEALYRHRLPRAGTELGNMYLYAKGMQYSSLTEAKAYFAAAGEDGDPDGRIMYAYVVMEQDPGGVGEGEGGKIYLSREAEAGSPLGQFMLAIHYLHAEKFLQSAAWMRKAAEQGHVEAMGFLGNMYTEGQGVEKDLEKGMMWLRKASEAGELSSQLMLVGYLVQGAEGAEIDMEEGLKWAHECARQGDLTGMRILAMVYGEEGGQYADKEQAEYWTRKISEAEKE